MGEPNEKQDVNTSAEQEDTSKTEPETFTKEQVEEREHKVRSDALAEVGRYRVATEKAVKSANAAETRLTQFIKNQEEAELAAAGDDSEKQTTIRERQGRRTAETELAKTKQELDDEKAKTTEAQEVEAKHTKERNAREVATRLQVDAKTLIEFTDGSVEAMEKLAKVLPKKGEAKTLTPDSGKTTGGGESFTRQQIENMSAEEFEKKQDAINAARRAGRIK